MSLPERTAGVESERTVLVGVYINAPANPKILCWSCQVWQSRQVQTL